MLSPHFKIPPKPLIINDFFRQPETEYAMKYLPLIALTLLITACGDNNAKDPALYPNENIRDRQTAFKVIGGDMTLLSNAINGSAAFDKAKFDQQVADLVQHAERPFAYFGDNDKGGKSRPEVWLNPQGFDAEKQKFLAAVAAFQQANQHNDQAQIKATFNAISQTCKSCHDSFKVK